MAELNECLASIDLASEFARLAARGLQSALAEKIKCSKDFEKFIQLEKWQYEDLNFWIDAPDSTFARPIRYAPPSLTVTSDASKLGISLQ